MPQIHLVTYATPRFRHRQILLGLSARLNGVADTVTAWTPAKLARAGFADRCPGIGLSERGSGYWAWKPFVIAAKLRTVPDGDWVFYCDVGRNFPFKLLDQPITPYITWMEERGQEMMPGVLAPWDGTVGNWTKRAALQAFGADRPEIHAASPIQASFSIWRASDRSRGFVESWLEACSKRILVSDDPGGMESPELEDFREHRHDQALLTLCCLRDGVTGLDIGLEKPPFDAKHPSWVSRYYQGLPLEEGTGMRQRALRALADGVQKLEEGLRKYLKFGR